jgi:hypothetical protein
MAKISFLELVPKRPRMTVTIESESGPAEFELTGILLPELADIAKRYPSFAGVIEGGAGLFTATDAMPAIVAAGLGHHGDAEYEKRAAQLPTDLVLAIAGEIVKLTFPARPSIALAEPEPALEVEEEAVHELRPVVISPLRLSS